MKAFKCSNCGALYRESDEAEDCCRCQECKSKFPKNGYGNNCGHCYYGHSIREARRDVRRHADSLKTAEERLAELLAAKRPPKGSAQI